MCIFYVYTCIYEITNMFSCLDHWHIFEMDNFATIVLILVNLRRPSRNVSHAGKLSLGLIIFFSTRLSNIWTISLQISYERLRCFEYIIKTLVPGLWLSPSLINYTLELWQ